MGKKSKNGKKKNLPVALAPQNVEWVVNDLAELGVRIGGTCYFLYKSGSLVYKGRHDDGTTMMVRPVEKYEFGTVCRPPHMWEAESEARYTEGDGWTPLT